jgi:hypothetical protein
LLTDDSARSQQLPTTHNKLACLTHRPRSSILKLLLLTTCFARHWHRVSHLDIGLIRTMKMKKEFLKIKES